MPVRRSLAAAVLAASPLLATPASAQFSGDLGFTPDGCMARRECTLKYPLTFIDPDRRTWRADAGDLTDGASIPDWAQAIIGGPWDESYLKAAVMHDHYCGRHEYSWRETHLMFYNALIDLGVSEFKAKVMYYAVYVGGPRWIDVLAEGCEGRPAAECAKDKTLRVVKTIMRPSKYDKMDMAGEMRAAEDHMAIKPDTTLRELEKMAQDRHPDDMFYQFGGGILAEQAPARGVK